MKGRRIAIRGPREAVVEEFEVPAVAGHGEILLRVAYSLISPGTELSGYNAAGRTQPSHPGYTAVGEALAVGTGADPGLAGKTVYVFPVLSDTNHCHATHKLLKPGGLALPLPDGLDPRRACFARIVNIGLTPYLNADPKCCGTVFVVGLGLVGNVAAQVGRIRGFHTIGADPNPSRRRRAVEAGVDVVFDPTEKNPAEFVRSLTNGQGADLTINATGRGNTFLMSVEATAAGGEVSTLGGARGEAQADMTRFIGQIHSRHITLRGGWEMLLPMTSVPASKVASTEMNLRNAMRWLATGAIRLESVWTHTIRPEQFKAAYDALNALDDSYLGVIVDWT
jgi:threonine dehydrogenase-like Zn-dependent dehydrogenase